jgi:hypothetical protein
MDKNETYLTSAGGFQLIPVYFEHVAEAHNCPKFFKVLRIEIENYPIIQTMGMY